MIKITYYSHFLEILETEFPSDILVITPNPTLSDAFREMIHSKFEVITIAKWMKEVKIPKEMQKVGKSELMLRLASAWRAYFPEESENVFFNAFEYFTELRSFSVDLNFIAPVIDEFDQKIAKSIKLFWAVLESLKLVDEHQAYQLLKNIKNDRPILFLGFKNLSGVQIDLIKFLSDNQDIYFFIPKLVKVEAYNNDWINWLDSNPIRNDIEGTKNKLSVILYPENKINSYLKKINLKSSLAIVSSDLNIFNIQELLVNNLSFKQSINLFDQPIRNIFINIEKVLPIAITDLKVLIDGWKKESIVTGSYRDYKVYDLIDSALEIYQDYSLILDFFSFCIVKNVVELNAPRNFMTTISKDETKNKIYMFDQVKFIDQQESVIIIFTKDYSPFSSKGSKFPENIIKILQAIGPIKRSGLDVLFFIQELEEILKRRNITLMIDESMKETDPGIKKLLAENEVEYIRPKNDYVEKELRDLFAESINIRPDFKRTYSASKLQTYVDCPRKFYALYVEHVDDTPAEKIIIGHDEKGNLEHEIIEEYFSIGKNIEIEELKLLADQKLKTLLKERFHKVDEKEYFEALYEIVEFAHNGLSYLKTITDSRKHVSVKFERPLPKNKFELQGFIDCIIEDGDTVEIYDFKRSSTSVGSEKDLKNYEKIQLWVYAYAVSQEKKVTKIGYINLSDTSSNKVLEIGESLVEFELKLSEIIFNLNNDKEFPPQPRKESICHYCPLTSICIKGSGHVPNT